MREVIKGRDVEKLILLARDLHEQLCNTEEDLNYLQVVFDGSWPTAVEQLTKALERAKTLKESDRE